MPYTKKSALLLAVAWALVIISGCQKDLDYTKPADANTFKDDEVAAFNNLTDGDPIWAWGLPESNGTGFFLRFSKDSTANIYAFLPKGLVADLTTLLNSGTLTTGEAILAQQLVDDFTGLEDALLRQLLESPNNASYKKATLFFLPNYSGFSSLDTIIEKASFDINGPIQLSLTFHNSQLLSSMKEAGTLDFDFRIMKANADSVNLTGYYNDNSNRISTLYKTTSFRPEDFVAASNLIIALNPTKAKVSLQSGGAAIAVPAGYNSGLDFFYKSFRQTFVPTLGYVFSPNGTATGIMPDALKSAEYLTVKNIYNGSPATALAGTVLLTLSVYNKDGNGPDIAFIKD